MVCGSLLAGVIEVNAYRTVARPLYSSMHACMHAVCSMDNGEILKFSFFYFTTGIYCVECEHCTICNSIALTDFCHNYNKRKCVCNVCFIISTEYSHSLSTINSIMKEGTERHLKKKWAKNESQPFERSSSFC